MIVAEVPLESSLGLPSEGCRNAGEYDEELVAGVCCHGDQGRVTRGLSALDVPDNEAACPDRILSGVRQEGHDLRRRQAQRGYRLGGPFGLEQAPVGGPAPSRGVVRALVPALDVRGALKDGWVGQGDVGLASTLQLFAQFTNIFSGDVEPHETRPGLLRRLTPEDERAQNVEEIFEILREV